MQIACYDRYIFILKGSIFTKHFYLASIKAKHKYVKLFKKALTGY